MDFFYMYEVIVIFVSFDRFNLLMSFIFLNIALPNKTSSFTLWAKQTFTLIQIKILYYVKY